MTRIQWRTVLLGSMVKAYYHLSGIFKSKASRASPVAASIKKFELDICPVFTTKPYHQRLISRQVNTIILPASETPLPGMQCFSDLIKSTFCIDFRIKQTTNQRESRRNQVDIFAHAMA